MCVCARAHLATYCNQLGLVFGTFPKKKAGDGMHDQESRSLAFGSTLACRLCIRSWQEENTTARRARREGEEVIEFE